MKKKLFVGILFCALATVMLAKPVIKIGAVLPLSGNNSYLGEVARDALMMRLDEQGDAGKLAYKLLLEDDSYEPKRMAMAMRKLRNVDKVDTLMTMWGTGTEVAIPMLRGSKVLHMSCDRWIAKEFDYPYDFTYGSHQDLYSAAVVKALKELGVTRIATFGSKAAGLYAFFESFERDLEAAGIDVVSKAVVNLDQRDFRTWLLQMQVVKPQMLIVASDMPVGEIVLKQMKELGIDLPHMGVSVTYLEADKEYVGGYVTVLPAPSTGDFVERFQERYGYFPRYPAGQFYDAMGLLIAGYEAAVTGAGKPDVEAVCESLREQGQKFEGVLGKTNYIAPNRFDSPAVYYLVGEENLEPITLDEVVEIYREMISE